MNNEHFLDTFRQDLLLAMKRTKSGQLDIERQYGVSQGTISNFLRGRRGLSASALVRLWPFVYGHTLFSTKTIGSIEEVEENA